MEFHQALIRRPSEQLQLQAWRRRARIADDPPTVVELVDEVRLNGVRLSLFETGADATIRLDAENHTGRFGIQIREDPSFQSGESETVAELETDDGNDAPVIGIEQV